jgi:hypothetical protein
MILRKRIGSSRRICSKFGGLGPNEMIGIDGSMFFQNLDKTRDDWIPFEQRLCIVNVNPATFNGIDSGQVGSPCCGDCL